MIIEVNKQDLFKLVGKEFTDDELEEVLLNVKCETEIDGDTVNCEINPDRLDMVSVEGIARAIKGYLGLPLNKYETTDSKISVTGSSEVRPAFMAAVIENVKMTDELVKTLMQIQEKLHGSIGRDRKKVAIGVHDLDKIKGKIEYKDVDDITFIPLQETRQMNVKQILNEHPKGVAYAHLLDNKYPVFVDEEGVLSLPPIINSERTKVREDTKNLFIDVTGTDIKAVENALNILLCNVAERMGKIKTVRVNREKIPKFEEKSLVLSKEEVNDLLGLDLENEDIKKYLEKMLYRVTIKGSRINVYVPPYRSDILHPVDLIEDVAIGYGYANLEPVLPEVVTIGSLTKKSVLTRKVREMMVGFGFNEFLNFVLTSKENNFDKMMIPSDTIFEDIIGGEPIEIINPVSSEYNICRTWLTPSLIKILASNLHVEYPQKIFEVGDVICVDEKEETRTKTIRKLAGAISHDNANLTEIKSITEAVLNDLGIKYEIKSMVHDSFISTRCGEIFSEGKSIGFFGELHPKVLTNWKIERPVIAFEISLEDLY